MIGNTWWQYIFIRICIILLQYVIPLGALCCVILLYVPPFGLRIPIFFAVWAWAETLFFSLVFLPRYFLLQRDTIHPAPLPREERQKLFRLCMESVSDPEQYLCMWFKGAPLHEIGRENVKQFFCWSFLNKSNYGLLDDAELEDYANQLESRLGRELPPGKGPAYPLKMTLDPVHILPRPLIWYLVS